MNAVEPLVVVVSGFAQTDRRLEILEQAWWIRFPWSAVDPDGALGTIKDGSSPPLGDGSVDDLDAVLVNEPYFLLPLLGRDHLDRSGVVRIHAPLSNVEVMGSHVGQVAVAIFGIGPPAREVVMDVVGAEDLVEPAGRGRSLPGIPVDPIGYLLGRKVAGLRGTSHADADFFDLPDCPATDEFHGFAEFAPELGSLLAAGLEDYLVFIHCLYHGPPFLNGE